MSELPSMLVPLTGTFPGWPTAQQPSVVQSLLVLIGIPVALGALITLLTLARGLARRGRGQALGVSRPLWLGQTSSARYAATGSGRAALTDGAVDETTTGGARVRW